MAIDLVGNAIKIFKNICILCQVFYRAILSYCQFIFPIICRNELKILNIHYHGWIHSKSGKFEYK